MLRSLEIRYSPVTVSPWESMAITPSWHVIQSLLGPDNGSIVCEICLLAGATQVYGARPEAVRSIGLLHNGPMLLLALCGTWQKAHDRWYGSPRTKANMFISCTDPVVPVPAAWPAMAPVAPTTQNANVIKHPCQCALTISFRIKALSFVVIKRMQAAARIISLIFKYAPLPLS